MNLNIYLKQTGTWILEISVTFWVRVKSENGAFKRVQPCQRRGKLRLVQPPRLKVAPFQISPTCNLLHLKDSRSCTKVSSSRSSREYWDRQAKTLSKAFFWQKVNFVFARELSTLEIPSSCFSWSWWHSVATLLVLNTGLLLLLQYLSTQSN